MAARMSGNVTVRQSDSHTLMVRPAGVGCAYPDKSLTPAGSILTKFCHPGQPLIGHRELPGGGVGQCLDLLEPQPPA